MEISGGLAVGVGGGTVVSLIGWFVRERFEAIKGAQKLLFSKCDENKAAMGDFRVHVAETYVNQAALEKALAPINKSLEQLHQDLKDGRRPA